MSKIDRSIEINSLRFQNMSFISDRVDLPIFKDVDIELPLNEVYHVTGQSGVGKSILLRMLAGLTMPSEGDYLINDQIINEMSFEEFLPYRFKIGFSFDHGGLLNNRTIADNLTLPLFYHNFCEPEEIAAITDELVQVFNLQGCLNQRPSMIPGSRRKAAIVARAFVMNPEMLVLDDPTTGLTAEVNEKLVRLILRRMKKGQLKHVFIASEDRSFINGICSKELLIEDSKLVVSDFEAEHLIRRVDSL